MKILKKTKINIGVIIVITFVLCQTTITVHDITQNSRISDEKSSYFSVKNESGLTRWQGFKGLILNKYLPLFGYKFDATSSNPIERDETATLILLQDQQSAINVEIRTKFRKFIYTDLSIDSEIIFDYLGDLIMCHFEIENPLKGFFMEINVYYNNSLINLAFDGDCYQLSYDGVFPKGFSQQSEATSLHPNDLFFSQELEQLLRQKQEKGLKVYNDRYLEQKETEVQNSSNQYPTRSISYTQYGISHEAFDFDVDYPEELSDDYWEPYTCIDIGIHRLFPSESQIKSDLQYYNKDQNIAGSGYDRDIVAYCMGTHGGPEWEIYEWKQSCGWISCTWVQKLVGTIYPSEITDLWYSYWNPAESLYIYVYPTDTLIMVDVCYGYSDGPSGDPTMAKAFVNYGAAAFVGPTIETPPDSDSFMRVFWHSLCHDDQTVAIATTNLCNDYGNNWNIGDEWKIYGDSTTTLPN